MFYFALKNISTGKYVTRSTHEDGAGSVYYILGYYDDDMYVVKDREYLTQFTDGTAVDTYHLECDLIMRDYENLRIIPIPFP